MASLVGEPERTGVGGVAGRSLIDMFWMDSAGEVGSTNVELEAKLLEGAEEPDVEPDWELAFEERESDELRCIRTGRRASLVGGTEMICSPAAGPMLEALNIVVCPSWTLSFVGLGVWMVELESVEYV